MASSCVKTFLESQELSFKLFLAQCSGGYNYEEIDIELATHCERLKALADEVHAKTASSSPPCVQKVTPKRTSAGKPLTPAGASTIFQTGSDKKRRRSPEDDDLATDSSDSIAVDTISSTPRKGRLVSASQLKREAVHDNTTGGDEFMDVDNDMSKRTSFLGTARRGRGRGVSGSKKFVFDHPLIRK